MRILRVADVPDNRIGGMSRAMYLSGDQMTRLGHTVDYLFADHLGPTGDPRTRRFVIPWWVPSRVRQWARARGRYDVVEVHEPLTAGYCLARLADRDLPPVVGLSHGLESRSWSAGVQYRRVKGLPVRVRQRVSPISVVGQAELGLRLCDHVACLNTEDEAALQAKGLPGSRITRTRSGVGDHFLQAGAAPLDPARAGRVLFIGSWIERKGILDLVPAVLDVFARVPAARLTVAGCGAPETEVLGAFPAAARGRVDVVPKVTGDDELIALYRSHAVLVLPSYFEGQPLVMLEAAALRLAVLTTAVCGMKDFVRDGENGLLVRPADTPALAARLHALVTNPDLTRRLGEEAHRSASDHTWDRVARELLSAYEAAVSYRTYRRGIRTPTVRPSLSPEEPRPTATGTSIKGSDGIS